MELTINNFEKELERELELEKEKVSGEKSVVQ